MARQKNGYLLKYRILKNQWLWYAILTRKDSGVLYNGVIADSTGLFYPSNDKLPTFFLKKKTAIEAFQYSQFPFIKHYSVHFRKTSILMRTVK